MTEREQTLTFPDDVLTLDGDVTETDAPAMTSHSNGDVTIHMCYYEPIDPHPGKNIERYIASKCF